jgi:hypothetical protein
MFSPHETMCMEEIRELAQGVWDSFHRLREILGPVEVRCLRCAAGWRCRRLFEAKPIEVPVLAEVIGVDVRRLRY